MACLLALDLGNTRLHAGLVRDGAVTAAAAWPVDGLPPRAFAARVRAAAPPAAAFVSVRPRADAALRRLVRRWTGLAAVKLGAGRPIPVVNRTRQPSQVGADRLVHALAAHARAKGACVVAAFGTAVTIDAVAPDGAFLGGAILPGLRLQARALHAHCAQLPDVWEEWERLVRRGGRDWSTAVGGVGPPSNELFPHDGGQPRSLVLGPPQIGVVPRRRGQTGNAGDPPLPPLPVLGRTTDEAIRAGLLYGLAGGARRLIDVARRELGAPKARLFLAGGDAPLVRELLGEGEVVPHLALEGIARAYGAVKAGD